MAREWRVSSFPGFHNFLVNIGGQVIASISDTRIRPRRNKDCFARTSRNRLPMHKDQPPGLLEKPFSVIVSYGLLIGFVAGTLTFTGWSFFSSVTQRGTIASPLSQRGR